MTPEDLEAVYETLATRLDMVPADKRALYLAKLALLQAEALGDAAATCAMIAAAAENLDA